MAVRKNYTHRLIQLNESAEDEDPTSTMIQYLVHLRVNAISYLVVRETSISNKGLQNGLLEVLAQEGEGWIQR